MKSPRVALDLIRDILVEVAPENHATLLEIVAIEETHLSDKGTSAVPAIAACIERASKEIMDG